MYLEFYNTAIETSEKGISVFLAGPTERTKPFTQWRVDFLNYLSDNYSVETSNDLFYIPEFFTSRNEDVYPVIPFTVDTKEDILRDKYNKIYKWERDRIRKCDVLVFWVDRNIEQGRPAFTTNIEFGEFHAKPNTIIGSPRNAEKIDYMRYIVEQEDDNKWHYSFNEMADTLMDIQFRLQNSKKRI